MKLTQAQIKKLRAAAHSLKPVVLIGKNGTSDSVLKDINLKLDQHELIKIKISSDDQESFQSMVKEIDENTMGSIIQKVGHTVIYFRKHPEKSKFNF